MEQLFEHYWWAFVLAAAWSLPWKGYALWKAARLNDRWWFAALLVVNTLAIVDILYIVVFSKRKPKSSL